MHTDTARSTMQPRCQQPRCTRSTPSCVRALLQEKETAVKALGAKFRSTVLELGGAVPAGEVYRRFRGRPARVDALLSNYGFTA